MVIQKVCYMSHGDKSGAYFMKYGSSFEKFENSIGYRFHNRLLLEEALTHSSAINELVGRNARDYERLEFLGDAVLGLMVALLLLERFPDKQEGELSRMRAMLVGEKNLARLARSLEIGNFLILGKGERSNGGVDRSSILADAFEALLAAIYLDGGSDSASRFVRGYFEPLLDTLIVGSMDHDYKTVLQELTHSQFGGTPQYSLDGVSGPPHAQRFEVSVLLSDKLLGKGEGSSKKEAAQQAARAALLRLRTGSQGDPFR